MYEYYVLYYTPTYLQRSENVFNSMINIEIIVISFYCMAETNL